jgi:hypothetical protein
MSEFQLYYQALIAVGREHGCTCQYGPVDLVELDGDEPGAIVPHRRDCPIAASLVAG